MIHGPTFLKRKNRIETNVAFADAQSRVNFLSSVGACATVENFHLPFMTAEKEKKNYLKGTGP